MEILSGLNDNQEALLMCGAALLGCGLIMSLSYFIGASHSSSASTSVVESERPAAVPDVAETHRKAA